MRGRGPSVKNEREGSECEEYVRVTPPSHRTPPSGPCEREGSECEE